MARRRSRRRLSPAEKKALASLRDYVREQGLNDTAPRRAVLIAALRMRSRFSAEDLVAELASGAEPVSRATVFRSLALLVDSGHLMRRDLDEGVARYEAGGHCDHDHLVCSRCRKVTTFRSPSMRDVILRAARRNGFEVESVDLKLLGCCRDCRD